MKYDSVLKNQPSINKLYPLDNLKQIIRFVPKVYIKTKSSIKLNLNQKLLKSKAQPNMITAAMMRQLRILEIIILCFLAKTLEGKSFEPQNDRTKRGFGHYGGNGKFN